MVTGSSPVRPTTVGSRFSGADFFLPKTDLKVKAALHLEKFHSRAITMKNPTLRSRLRAGLAYLTWLVAFLFFFSSVILVPPRAHQLKNAIFLFSFLLLLAQPLLSWLYLRRDPVQEYDQEHSLCALTVNSFFFTIAIGLSAILVATLPLIALWYFIGMWVFLVLGLWVSLWTVCSTLAACLALLGIEPPASLLSKLRTLSLVKRVESALDPRKQQPNEAISQTNP